MGKAKNIHVAPISSADARSIVRRHHYSGKVTQNSQLHFGVFYEGKCEGALQFGPPIDRRRMLGTVEGTHWNGMIELNRLAFSDALPRNSESRALSIALRIIKKKYPHIEWVLSFADACQCGDGGIYRATGFVLTQIKKNTTLLKLPDGQIVANKTLDNDPVKGSHYWRKKGARPIPGHQLRYIYFCNEDARARLVAPEIPYSKIQEIGAGMYKGIKREKQAMAGTTGTAAGKHRPSRSIDEMESA